MRRLRAEFAVFRAASALRVDYRAGVEVPAREAPAYFVGRARQLFYVRAFERESLFSRHAAAGQDFFFELFDFHYRLPPPMRGRIFAASAADTKQSAMSPGAASATP